MILLFTFTLTLNSYMIQFAFHILVYFIISLKSTHIYLYKLFPIAELDVSIHGSINSFICEPIFNNYLFIWCNRSMIDFVNIEEYFVDHQMFYWSSDIFCCKFCCKFCIYINDRVYNKYLINSCSLLCFDFTLEYNFLLYLLMLYILVYNIWFIWEFYGISSIFFFAYTHIMCFIVMIIIIYDYFIFP